MKRRSESAVDWQRMYVDYVKLHHSALTFKTTWRKRCPASLSRWSPSNGVSVHGWLDRLSGAYTTPAGWWVVDCCHAECKPPPRRPWEVVVSMSKDSQLRRCQASIDRLSKFITHPSVLVPHAAQHLDACLLEKTAIESSHAIRDFTLADQHDADDEIERNLLCTPEIETLCRQTLADLACSDTDLPDVLRRFWDQPENIKYIELWSTSTGRRIPWKPKIRLNMHRA